MMAQRPDSHAPRPDRHAEGTTWAEEGASSASAIVVDARVIAGRYRLGALLGHGGQAVVHAAEDLLDAARGIAVKLHRRAGDDWLVRSEIALMRRAAMPGVATVLDDGILPEGGRYLVMERAPGSAFPRMAGARLLSTARAIVETLSRLHALGVVHGDLKPSNVLVSGDRVTLLDFGIARTAGRAAVGCTPAFAAPEQLAGEVIGPPADMYSVGVLLALASTGTIPLFDADDPVMTAALRDNPPDDGRRPGVGEPLDGLVADLLSPDPRLRPTAEQALARLGGPTDPVPARSFRHPARDWQDLRTHFAGPDHFLHLREDPARELWARTGGHPDAMRAEVGSWLRAGVARRSGRQIRVSRRDVDRLRAGLRLAPGAPPGVAATEADHEVLIAVRALYPDATVPLLADTLDRPTSAVSAALARLQADGLVWRHGVGFASRITSQPGDVGWSAIARRMLRCALLHADPEARTRLMARLHADDGEGLGGLLDEARRRVRDGDRAGAQILLTAARATAAPDAGHERRMLELLVVLAVQAEDHNRLLHARFAVSQARKHRLAVLDDLAAAAIAARFTGDVAEAHALLRPIPPFADPLLEEARHTVVSWALRAEPDEEGRYLHALDAWAGAEPDRQRFRCRLLGLWAYRSSRFDEAVAQLRRSLGPDPGPGERCNLALALVETGGYAEAGDLTAAAMAQASAQRQPVREAYAWLVSRSARYRHGHVARVRDDLLPALREVSPRFAVHATLVEAAVAWRLGQHAKAASLATQAAQAFRAHHMSSGAALASALAAFLTDRAAVAPPADAPPLVRLQCAALRGARPEDALVATCRALVPAPRWSLRREVLSPAEALSWTRGEP